MTLSECIERLRTRVEVDLEAEVNLDDATVAARHLIRGAQFVTRATFNLYVPNASLTLAANDQQIDLVSSQCVMFGTSTEARIFRLDTNGLYINGGWITECRMQEFYRNFPDYLTATASPHPSFYTEIRDNVVLLDKPIDATGAAASNYAKGWREHASYTWAANEATEMEGPEAYHLLYVDQAALDVSKSYVSGTEALRRRGLIQEDLQKKIGDFAEANQAAFRDTRRPGLAGNTRRIVSLSGY